jgi:surface carbohydrate biosynthesis protein
VIEMDKYLYFPIEVGTRELLSRFLTACIAAEKGFRVLIGYQYTLLEHATVLPLGVYFSKGTNAVSLKNLEMVKDQGHAVAVCEEENFFRSLQDNPIVIGHDDIFDVCDLYLAVSPDEKDYLTSRFGASIPVVCCGNARSDILRSEFRPMFDEEVKSIRKLFGSHILINTNFGILNNGMPNNTPQKIFETWLKIGVFSSRLNSSEKIQIFKDYMSFEKSNMAIINQLIVKLVADGFSIVIRPHPVEDVATWKLQASSFGKENIRVVSDGNHIPAILASELLLHTACTTGVEALLLGVPVLCLGAPESSKASSYHLARRFNDVAYTVNEADKLIKGHLSGDRNLSKNRDRYIADLPNSLSSWEPKPLASEMIATQLIKLYGNFNFIDKCPPLNGRILKIIQESSAYKDEQYMQNKFGLEEDFFTRHLKYFQMALQRFKTVNVSSVSDSVFMVHSSEK